MADETKIAAKDVWLSPDSAPMDGTKVLVACVPFPANKAVFMESAWFDPEEGQWIGYFGNCGYALASEIIAWRPLPKPPKFGDTQEKQSQPPMQPGEKP